MSPATGESRDPQAVRAFFDQWDLYRKIRDLDYLHHRAAYAALGTQLPADAGFSFLDLGAGDAEWSVRTLAQSGVGRYEAVDLSPVALDLARRRAVELPGEKRFVVGDFADRVLAGGTPFDVVWIGLSLHHLPAAEKRNFLRVARALVRPGGRFLCYEPILLPGETRDGVMARWWRFAREHWDGLSVEERERARAHIFENDHPESVEGYRAMLAEAGFAAVEVVFRSPDDFYAVFSASA